MLVPIKWLTQQCGASTTKCKLVDGVHSIYKKINMISVIFALLSSTEGIRTEPARRLLVNGSVISDNAGTPILLRGYAHVTPHSL